MKANRTSASFLRVRHVGCRTQLSADGHCVLLAAPVIVKDTPFVRISEEGVQNQLGV